MNHEIYMKMAFNLALKGLGHTSPNPLVGAVIVRDNNILGVGFHQKYGSAHAEVNAILDAKAKGFLISGATLYCNLEPCSHTNKNTPPCTPSIIEEKFSCVVISTIDPNPNVSGNGVRLLREHGVEVITGVLEEDGLKLNEVFFKYITTNLPFVHLKLAQSLDGRVATKNGESKYITGKESLARVHSLRQKYDCIMVGRKTVEFDNPSLTTRTDEFESLSHPLRIVVGKLNGLNHNWKIFQDEYKNNTMIMTTDDDVKNNPEVVHFLESQGVAFLPVKKNEEGSIDLESILKALASLKLTSILIEGGPMLATAFLKASLVDKVSFFVAPVIIGEGKNAIENLGINSLMEKLKLHSRRTEILGDDILIEGYLCLPV